MVYEKTVRLFNPVEDDYETGDDSETFFEAPYPSPPHALLDGDYPENHRNAALSEARVDSLAELLLTYEERRTPRAIFARKLLECGRLQADLTYARGPHFTEHHLMRGYLISKLSRSFRIPQLFNRETFPNEAFQTDSLESRPFEPNRIQYSPDGRYILFSSAEIDRTVDLTICDPHGRRIHRYEKPGQMPNSLHKDICWLDENHFAVRFSTAGLGIPDDVEYIYDHLDNSPRADVLSVFDIRKHAEPVETKTLPFGIRRFHPVREADGTSWLLGTGRMLNQLPMTPSDPELFNEGITLMQMKYAHGCFGEHQLFPEMCPIIPAFPISDELYVHWMLSSSTHVIPSHDPSDRPSLLLVKNLWDTAVFWEQELYNDWPKFKLIQPSVDSGSLLGNSAVEARTTYRIPGFYGTMDVTADPLGGGFLSTIVSLTPMKDEPGPDRDVAVYHFVYFKIVEDVGGNGYEVIPWGVTQEASGPGYYKATPCFAGNGLYAAHACGNELEFVTNGRDARPFGENPTGDLQKLRTHKRIRFGNVDRWEQEDTCIMSTTVNPANYLEIAVLTLDGNLRIIQPKW